MIGYFRGVGEGVGLRPGCLGRGASLPFLFQYLKQASEQALILFSVLLWATHQFTHRYEPSAVVSFSLAIEIGKVQIAHRAPIEISKTANQKRKLRLIVFMVFKLAGLTSRMSGRTAGGH